MNIFYATFTNTEDPVIWKFVTKIYRADSYAEAKENFLKDWGANYFTWSAQLHTIPYFDEFGSWKVSEVYK